MAEAKQFDKAVVAAHHGNVAHIAIPLRERLLRDDFATIYEAAAIKGIPTGDENQKRDSICLSVANGCKVGCRYCATGLMTDSLYGMAPKRPTPELLVEQFASALTAARSIFPDFCRSEISAAFMGKGEPLLYPFEVAETINQLHNQGLVTRTTVSTSLGSKPITRFREALDKYVQKSWTPFFQISLHSPNMDQRRYLVRTITNLGEKAETPLEILNTVIGKIGALQIGSPADIRIRHTLLKWGDPVNPITNFEREDILAFAAELAELNSGLSNRYDKPIRVSVALHNDTELTHGTFFETTEVERDGVIDLYKSLGVPSYAFARGSVDQKAFHGGACGTMSKSN